MKKLPKGIPTFSEIIEDNYIYIDKTEYIYKMIDGGKLYFLSRPRRFGKSLLISTLGELFRGNKELFKGLYIYDKWDWDGRYPVVKLDFGNISHDTNKKLEISLIKYLNDTAKDFDVELDDVNLLTDKFAELIKKVHDKTGKRVVVLIDEYDKSISSHLDDIGLAKKNRDTLRSFYQVLKANDQYLKFLFITGISKFAKTSIFSDLNNVDDITIHPKYSKICGYSQKDLESYFDEYITEISTYNGMKKGDLLVAIKKWYNGYSWDGKNFLYNPFSVLKLLDTGDFANYWADTGTPKLLVDLLKTADVDMNILAEKKSEFVGSFPNFDLDNLDFATVLLQTGYLTIKDKNSHPLEPPIYTTAIPNKEVKDSLFSYILGVYTNHSTESVEPMTKSMLKYIYTQDEENLQRSFEILLHKIPNIVYGKIKHELEDYYKVLLISWIQLLGFDIESEIMTLEGRLDALVKHKDFVLIIEFKFDQEKSFESMFDDAGSQIIEMGYYKPYQNKKIIVLIIAFHPRNLRCKFKMLEDVLK
ncbi:MAG: ATP-binding protein [Methanobrevibacter sp.]|jgi:hypothetical protein|nr:ATP-binding protein [Candidatus Methanovirga basalitermitum]